MSHLHAFENTNIGEKLKLGKKIIIGFMFSFLILPFMTICAESLDNGLTRVNDKVSTVNQGVRNVNNTVGGVNNTVNNVNSTINNVSKTFDSIRSLFSGNDGGASLPNGDFILPSSGEYNMVQTESLRTFIQNVLNFVITFVGVIGVAAVIYSGYLYVMAGGEDGNIDKAKKIITYVAVGILVISSSYAIVNTIINETVTGGADRGGAGGGTHGGVINLGNIPTSYAPGTTLPAGTVVGDGLRLIQDTIVNTDGTVSVADDLLPTTDTLNLVSLLSFQNGITVSGNGVTDLGNSAIISNDAAAAGVDLGLTMDASAIFDFGDGTQGILDTISSPGTTISHRFGSGRTYAVKVKAQTSDGALHSFEKNIVVGGTQAAFSLSRDKLLVGESFVMDGGQSHVSIGSIQSYNWSCSGGSGCFNDIEGPSITASFGSAGIHTVTLTIQNAIGSSDSISKNITVLNDEPVAQFLFQSENNTASPSEFRFDASSSQNVEGGSDGLVYEWSFDGFIIQKTTPITTYRFTSEGDKTVTLKVYQQINGQKITSEAITKIVDVQTTLSPNFNIAQ